MSKAARKAAQAAIDMEEIREYQRQSWENGLPKKEGRLRTTWGPMGL
jgi:hypothetical protein